MGRFNFLDNLELGFKSTLDMVKMPISLGESAFEGSWSPTKNDWNHLRGDLGRGPDKMRNFLYDTPAAHQALLEQGIKAGITTYHTDNPAMAIGKPSS